jgi:hypothetical protein
MAKSFKRSGLSNCDIGLKQNISVFDETVQYETKMRLKFGAFKIIQNKNDLETWCLKNNSFLTVKFYLMFLTKFGKNFSHFGQTKLSQEPFYGQAVPLYSLMHTHHPFCMNMFQKCTNTLAELNETLQKAVRYYQR